MNCVKQHEYLSFSDTWDFVHQDICYGVVISIVNIGRAAFDAEVIDFASAIAEIGDWGDRKHVTVTAKMKDGTRRVLAEFDSESDDTTFTLPHDLYDLVDRVWAEIWVEKGFCVKNNETSH